MKLPENETGTYERIEIDYTLEGNPDIDAYVYDGAFDGTFGQYSPGAHKESKLTVTDTIQTAVFEAGEDYSGNEVKAIKLFNYGDSATLRISAARYIRYEYFSPLESSNTKLNVEKKDYVTLSEAN